MKRNSVWKILVVLSFVLGMTTNFESVSAKPNHEEAPQVPTLLSPGNGSVASSNPPTLCAQASDPDGNLQGIKFEINGGGEGDHISPFIQVDGNGTACWQDDSPWSEQDHAWQARAVDSAGNQSGASSQWGIKIPATAAPSQSETCVVNDLYADRSAPQTVGTIINFTVVATCTNGVNKIKTFVDGHEAGIIQGGSGSISWNTNGYNAGNHVFSVKVFGNSGGTAGRSHPYDLTRNNQEQQQTNPNNSFGNCEAIKIGYDVFVIVKEGSAIQRRHVPNPETLDALGFSQQAINNKGFSDSELSIIGKGNDIPDVVVDPNGFNTFKSTFCPNTIAIVPNQNSEQLPAGQFDPHVNGVCPGRETRLWIGAYARVTNQGDQLKLRTGPTLNDSVITKMSAGQKFTVIGGPQCNDTYTWWNIQGDMGTGWAAEADDKWWMAPMTEAPTPSQDATEVPDVVQSNSVGSEDQNVSGDLVETVLGCNNWYDSFNCFLISMGVEPIGNFEVEASTEKPRCEPQCMTLMRRDEFRPDMNKWSVGTGDSSPLDVLANAEKETPYNDPPKTGPLMQVRVRESTEQPEAGDLIIWQAGCGGASDVGHIGEVVSSVGITVNIDDSNWDNNCGPRDDVQIQILPCMRFVTEPFLAGTYVPTVQPTVINCDDYQGWQNFSCNYIPWWKP